ncbi:MAG: FAD-dependent oxidoreductase [Caldilineaceae bacterium]
MANQIGTQERPLRVAIVGAGPSGFYATGSLLQQKDIQVSVDMFDRLPAPHGLVRYGVAPDHQKIKAVSKVYDRTAASARFRFFGNVEFGKDITHADLRWHYDQIIYAVGAQADRKLNIPGENLRGSLSATEFVAWYNGHPDFADLAIDLSCESAIVVGVGNVAMDVARILAKSTDELKATDMADYAVEALAASKIKDIYVLARRSAAQVKFTPPEIREFGELSTADVVVDPAELELDPLSAAEILGDTEANKNIEWLREYANQPLTGKLRRVHFRFLVSPVEIYGENGKVTAVRIEKNVLHPDADGYLNAQGTGQVETIPAGLVLRAVGYRSVPLPDVPYDTRKGIISNEQGRVKNQETGALLVGEYVVGWAKRGPTGVIGTNKPDAAETVQHIWEDLPHITPAPEPDPEAINVLFKERQIQYVSIEHWRRLDQIEVAEGEMRGKPRVKFTNVEEIWEALRSAIAA